MSIFFKKEKMSVDEFGAGLTVAFKRMREENIETLGKLIESVKEMNKDELMKLDWELSILNMFIITFYCRLLIKDEKISDKVLDEFHKCVYEDIKKIEPLVALAFQEESKIKCKSYFEAMNSSDPTWNLCKEAGKNIFGEPIKSSIKMEGIGIYINGNMKYIKGYITDMTKDVELVD